MYEPYFLLLSCEKLKNVPISCQLWSGFEKEVSLGLPYYGGPRLPSDGYKLCTGSLVERDVTGGCDLVTLCL